MSQPLSPDDPAYWMLQQGLADPDRYSTPVVIYDPNCYICNDPEFSIMGLPLCYPCIKCSSHVAADAGVCDSCGYSEYEYNEE